MKEKRISEAAPPSTTWPQPMTLGQVLGPSRWLPRRWRSSAAALHPRSHTPRWGRASPLHCEADSKLGHVTRKDDGFTAAWDLSEEIKKKKKKKNHEKSSSSLPEKLHRWCMCVEKGVWARVLPGLGSQTAKPQHPAR